MKAKRVYGLLFLGLLVAAGPQPKPTGVRDDAPEPIKRLWENRERTKADAMKTAVGYLRRLKATPTKPDPKTARARIVEQQKRMADIRNAIWIVPDYRDPDGLKAGTLGKLVQAQTVHVIDGKNAVINIICYRDTETLVPTGGGGVGARATTEEEQVMVWLEGYDTAGLVDGQMLTGWSEPGKGMVDKNVVVMIDGTKAVPLTDGSTRTMLHAVPINPDDYLVTAEK